MPKPALTETFRKFLYNRSAKARTAAAGWQGITLDLVFAEQGRNYGENHCFFINFGTFVERYRKKKQRLVEIVVIGGVAVIDCIVG